MKVKISTSPTQSEFEEIDLALTTRRRAECLIGRSPDSDLVLDSNDVSRLHGKFYARGGYYYFCDVGSRNGSIINGKLAEKDHSYQLKDGDIIRIGDFVLIMEEEMPDTQSAETVVRIINPSLISNWRQQNAGAAPQEAQLSNNESSVAPGVAPALVAEEINYHQEEVEQEIDKAVASHESTDTNEVEDNIASSIQHEAENVASFEPEQAPHTPQYTIVQASDTNEGASNIQHEAENVASFEPEQAPHTPEYTVVQASDTNEGASNIQHETENVASFEPEQAPHTPEYTVVQASDANEGASNIQHETENVASFEPEQAPYIEETEVQIRDVDEEAISVADETENVASLEPEQAPHTPEHIEVKTHDISDSEEDVTNSAEPINQHEEESEIAEVISNDSENVGFDTPVQQVEELVPETPISTPELDSQEVISTTQETEEVEEKLPKQLAKILGEKYIVLVSHDSKKPELASLVSEHEEFLSRCLTRTWQTFRNDLYNQTGLSVTQEIPTPTSGGYQAINSLVNSGEILAVIFIRDLMMAPQAGQASEEALLRICNINNVLLATNLPTAKAILYYLENLKDS